MAVRYYCDRCGKEGGHAMWKIVPDSFHRNGKSICSDCSRAFDEWMKGGKDG